MRRRGMRLLVLAAVAAIGLAACDEAPMQRSEPAAEQEEAQAPPMPPPPPPPAQPTEPPASAPAEQGAGDQPASDAARETSPTSPTGQGEFGTRSAPSGPTIAPPAPPLSPGASDQPAILERRAPPPGDGTSGVATRRVISAVLVELMPTEARIPRQGGSAVALLARPGSSPADAKNLALCQALFQTFDRATNEQVDVGSRRTAEGETQLLRPLYWLTRQETALSSGADRCPQRLNTYDFARSDSIRRKLGLEGEGPYLVVERADQTETERVAAVIDLSRARPREVADITRYFRDGMMQSRDVWDSRRFAPERSRQDMASALGRTISTALLPRIVRTTRQVGCAFTNLLDVCEARAPG